MKKIFKINNLNYFNNSKIRILKQTFKVSFSKFSNKSYTSLSLFNPDLEAIKHYKDYFLNYSKKELQNLLKEKEEKIQQKIPKNSKFNQLSQYLTLNEFKLELKDTVNIIFKDIVSSKETNLQDLSEYNFKQEGKMIRPLILLLISKYVQECLDAQITDNIKNNNKNLNENQIKRFAACVEVLHNASLLHDDIIDNSDKRRNLPTAHKEFGIRNAVFGANYIISRAANLIIQLDKPELNEIFSTMVHNLTYGECEQSLKSLNFSNIDEAFKVYMLKTYYKTASLIALSLRGLSIIYNLNQELQLQLFNLGLHIGIVFQLVDDVIDVIYESKDIKKPAFKDLEEGVINSYVLYEINDDNNKGKDLGAMAQRKFSGLGEKEIIKEQLKKGTGILKTQNLALDHLIDAFKILDNPFFIENKTKFNVLQCFNFIVNRKF